MGRSGSTYIRNLLGKLDENICLVTGKQMELIQTRHPSRALCSYDLLEFAEHDIKNRFSDTELDLQNAKNFFYKCPVSKLLSISDTIFTSVLPAIIINRHPVNVCRSSSKREFIEKSRSAEETKRQILITAEKLKFERIADFESEMLRYSGNALMTGAVIFKYSYLLQNLFFSRYHTAPVITFSFEHFIQEPENVFIAMLDFLGIEPAPEKISMLRTPFYCNAEEEGGIQMSSLIDSGKLNTIKYEDSESEELYSYLKTICDELGYSKECGLYPVRVICSNGG